MARLGSSFKPEAKVSPARLPKLPPGSPWQFAHHAKGGQVKDGQLLPRLNMIIIRPGVNHIGRDMDLGEMRVRFQERGWRFIPYDVGTPKGIDSYLQQVPVEGGFAYVSCFVRLVPGTSKVMSDQAGYVRFLKAVKKIVDPPAAWVLEDMRGTAEKAQTDLSLRADRVPAAARQLEQINADLKLIEKELDAALKRDAKMYEEAVIDGVE